MIVGMGYADTSPYKAWRIKNQSRSYAPALECICRLCISLGMDSHGDRGNQSSFLNLMAVMARGVAYKKL